MRHYFALLSLFVIMAGTADAALAQSGGDAQPSPNAQSDANKNQVGGDQLGATGTDESGRQYVVKHCQRTSCFAHNAEGNYREYINGQ